MCSPEGILRKGYAVVSKNGISIKDTRQIKENTEVEITFLNGKVRCKLINVEAI